MILKKFRQKAEVCLPFYFDDSVFFDFDVIFQCSDKFGLSVQKAFEVGRRGKEAVTPIVTGGPGQAQEGDQKDYKKVHDLHMTKSIKNNFVMTFLWSFVLVS